MKYLLTVVVYILTIFLIPVPVSAQDGFRPSLIAMGSGESPVSNGLSATLQAENQRKRMIEVTLQEEQAWVMYGPKFKTGRLEGLVAGSAGHFQGAPWAGPYLNAKFRLTEVAGQKVSVGTLQWPAFFIGREPNNWKNDGTKNLDTILVGHLSSFNLSVGPVSLEYSILNFLDDPLNHLPGASFTQKVWKDFAITASGTYNTNAEKPMFFIGGAWKIERK